METERGPDPLRAGGDAGREAPASRRFRLAALIFASVLGLAATLGFIAYRAEIGAARRELQRQMLAVARLKAAEIAHWLSERRDDVSGAATGPRIALDVERWRARGRIDPEVRDWVRGRIERFRAAGDYAEVAILDLDGSVLIAARGEPAAVPFRHAEAALRAMREQVVVFTPLDRPGGTGGGEVIMDAIAPLTAVDARGSRVVGALLYRIDPRRYLFPLVQSWPTDSPSAESYLVTVEGDSVLFLNDLRHRPATALSLRQPIEASDRIAPKAARGARGVIEGVDYRGVPVLAAVEEVEGSRWLLVSKVDQGEAYAPLREYLAAYLLFLVSAAATATLSARTWLRSVREASLRREHDATKAYVAALETAEAEREALIASLTKALDDVKTLRGIVPICASCKRVRDDAGFWNQVEAYVSEHTGAEFSHGVCPDCARRLYPEYVNTPAPPARG